MSKSDSFWFDKPDVLIQSDRLTEFFPHKEHTMAEKLNAILRLFIYMSVILSIYHKDVTYMYLAIGCAVFTFYIYKNHPNKANIVESFEKGAKTDGCVKPTSDNPFMNATMSDYMNVDGDGKIVERAAACDITDPDVKKDIDDAFNKNLFRDVNDVFGKMNSQRQFYTMPSTSIPNDPNLDFAKWLYLNEKTCKEDQEQCVRGIYEAPQQKRFVFQNENENPVNTKRDEAN